MPKTSRYAAIETLERLNRTALPVKLLFEDVSRECALQSAERGLAMNIVYGVLRHRQYLEIIIDHLSSRPCSKLDSIVRNALMVGLFQLIFLDRIPPSAAVNETVNALKTAGRKKFLQGFVNGILRTALRQHETLPPPQAPGPDGNPILNHPNWMTERWQHQFGKEETERICTVNSSEPLLVLRVNRCRTSRSELRVMLAAAGIAAQPGDYSPDSLVLPEFRGAINSLPGYADGLFQIQDEAAQMATLLLSPFRAGGRYLDCCAGLGGKTSHLLEKIHPLGGHVVAVEPDQRRQALLRDNIARLQTGNHLTVFPSTLQEYCRETETTFDGVMVDAPCSGTGVTGRHPDIRWNRRAEDLVRYQQIQREILSQACQLVAPGGILVYATCSLENEENHQVVSSFLQEQSDFTITDCSRLLPDTAADLLDGNFFHPHPQETIDGFFAARMQRRE